MDRIENLDCLLKKQKELEHTMDIRKANHDNTEYLELLICGGTGCVSSQSLKLLENLNQEIKNHGLENAARASITGCFGFCEQGPIVKVFPEDVFYVNVQPEDALNIVSTHLVQGRRVERLLYEEPILRKKVHTQHEMEFYKKQERIALRNCGLINPELIEEYIANRGYEALGRCLLEMEPKDVIHIIKTAGLLGRDIMNSGFDFDIDIKYGAGAFVCGEETALIHSIEGGRGEPTTKPPFPAESGLWGKPTSVNNVETFANVPAIIINVASWYNKFGSHTSKGTKVFALAGKINNVGLVEVPMGITLREIIYDIGGGIKDGKKLKAVQTGGPSGGCITADQLDVEIDYESLYSIGSMMGSGGMIVIDEDNCIVDIAKFYLEFTVEESCGKCTPCRVGNKRLYEMLTKIAEGKGTEEDLETMRNLAETIKLTSLCGLGQTAPNPVLSTMKYFYDEYLAHVRDKKCPAGVCQALLQYHISEDKCIGCTKCARVCPVSCISGKVKEVHVIDQELCIKCGACYEACPVNAISKG